MPNVAKTKQTKIALTDNGVVGNAKISCSNGDISFLKK